MGNKSKISMINLNIGKLEATRLLKNKNKMKMFKMQMKI